MKSSFNHCIAISRKSIGKNVFKTLISKQDYDTAISIHDVRITIKETICGRYNCVCYLQFSIIKANNPDAKYKK